MKPPWSALALLVVLVVTSAKPSLALESFALTTKADDIWCSSVSRCPAIVSLWPTEGPVEGGTQVTVSGANFNGSAGVLCHFGGISVAASVLSSKTLLCTSPQLPEGYSEFRVTQGAVDASKAAESDLLLYNITAFVGTGYINGSFVPPNSTELQAYRIRQQLQFNAYVSASAVSAWPAAATPGGFLSVSGANLYGDSAGGRPGAFCVFTGAGVGGDGRSSSRARIISTGLAFCELYVPTDDGSTQDGTNAAGAGRQASVALLGAAGGPAVAPLPGCTTAGECGNATVAAANSNSTSNTSCTECASCLRVTPNLPSAPLALVRAPILIRAFGLIVPRSLAAVEASFSGPNGGTRLALSAGSGRTGDAADPPVSAVWCRVGGRVVVRADPNGPGGLSCAAPSRAPGAAAVAVDASIDGSRFDSRPYSIMYLDAFRFGASEAGPRNADGSVPLRLAVRRIPRRAGEPPACASLAPGQLSAAIVSGIGEVAAAAWLDGGCALQGAVSLAAPAGFAGLLIRDDFSAVSRAAAGPIVSVPDPSEISAVLPSAPPTSGSALLALRGSSLQAALHCWLGAPSAAPTRPAAATAARVLSTALAVCETGPGGPSLFVSSARTGPAPVAAAAAPPDLVSASASIARTLDSMVLYVALANDAPVPPQARLSNRVVVQLVPSAATDAPGALYSAPLTPPPAGAAVPAYAEAGLPGGSFSPLALAAPSAAARRVGVAWQTGRSGVAWAAGASVPAAGRGLGARAGSLWCQFGGSRTTATSAAASAQGSLVQCPVPPNVGAGVAYVRLVDAAAGPIAALELPLAAPAAALSAAPGLLRVGAGAPCPLLLVAGRDMLPPAAALARLSPRFTSGEAAALARPRVLSSAAAVLEATVGSGSYVVQLSADGSTFAEQDAFVDVASVDATMPTCGFPVIVYNSTTGSNSSSSSTACAARCRPLSDAAACAAAGPGTICAWSGTVLSLCVAADAPLPRLLASPLASLFLSSSAPDVPLAAARLPAGHPLRADPALSAACLADATAAAQPAAVLGSAGATSGGRALSCPAAFDDPGFHSFAVPGFAGRAIVHYSVSPSLSSVSPAIAARFALLSAAGSNLAAWSALRMPYSSPLRALSTAYALGELLSAAEPAPPGAAFLDASAKLAAADEAPWAGAALSSSLATLPGAESSAKPAQLESPGGRQLSVAYAGAGGEPSSALGLACAFRFSSRSVVYVSAAGAQCTSPGLRPGRGLLLLGPAGMHGAAAFAVFVNASAAYDAAPLRVVPIVSPAVAVAVEPALALFVMPSPAAPFASALVAASGLANRGPLLLAGPQLFAPSVLRPRSSAFAFVEVYAATAAGGEAGTAVAAPGAFDTALAPYSASKLLDGETGVNVPALVDRAAANATAAAVARMPVSVAGGTLLVPVSTLPHPMRLLCQFRRVLLEARPSSSGFACVSPASPPGDALVALRDPVLPDAPGDLFPLVVRGAAATASAASAAAPPVPELKGAIPPRGPRVPFAAVLFAVRDWTGAAVACRAAGGALAGPGRALSTAFVLCELPAAPYDEDGLTLTLSGAGGTIEAEYGLTPLPSLEGGRAARRLPPLDRVSSVETGGATVSIAGPGGAPEAAFACVDVGRRIVVSGRLGSCATAAAAPGKPSALYASVLGQVDPSPGPLPLVYSRAPLILAASASGPLAVLAATGLTGARSVTCLLAEAGASEDPLYPRCALPALTEAPAAAVSDLPVYGFSLARCSIVTQRAGFVAVSLAADGVEARATAQVELLASSASWLTVPSRVPSNAGVLLVVYGDGTLARGATAQCFFDGRRGPSARVYSTAAAACEAPRSDILPPRAASAVRVVGGGQPVSGSAGAAQLRVMEPVGAYSVDVSGTAETGGTPVRLGGTGFDGGDSGVGCTFGRVFVRIAPVDGSVAICLSPALPARSSIVRMRVPELDLVTYAAWDLAACNLSAPATPSNGTCGPEYASRERALLRAVDAGDALGPRVRARPLTLRVSVGLSDALPAYDVADARFLSALAAFYASLSGNATSLAAGARSLLSVNASAVDGVLRYLQSLPAISGASIHDRRKTSQANNTCPAYNCTAKQRSLLQIESLGVFNGTLSNYTYYGLVAPVYPVRYSLDIDVQPVPYVTRLEPNSSFTKGYTRITVRGANFLNTPELQCQFGTNLVPATYVNSSTVVCFAPPQNGYGPMPVSVTNNGRNFGSGLNGATLLNYKACPIGSFCRGGNIFPCPRGHFCPVRVEGNRTWTDMQDASANADPYPEVVFSLVQCPPGTYQDEEGQAFCKPCIVGGVCPRLGMTYPDICPAGELCDQESLAIAKICPAGLICREGTRTGFGFNFTSKVNSTSKAVKGVMVTLNTTIVELPPEICWEAGDRPGSEVPPAQWPYAGQQPLRCNNESINVTSYDAIKNPPFGYPQLCPPSYYCESGTGSADVASNSTIGDFFYPQICFAGASCPAGMDNPQGEGLCQAGYYCVSQSGQEGARAQIPCPVGNFCPSQGLTKPTPCGEGSYQNQEKQVSCLPCELGEYCPNKAMSAGLPTDPGYFSPGYGTVNQRPCSAGSYTNSTRKSSCTACAPGTYATGDNNTKCTPAIPGTFVSYVGAAVPTLCNPGTYADAYGNLTCNLCPVGTYASGLGNQNCTLAPPGFFVNFAGAAQPSPCNPGTYQAFPGMKTCELCPPGFYTPLSGQQYCTPAPPGFVVPAKGSTEAQECPAGSYMPYSNASQCLQCQPGTYCPEKGLKTFKQADPGFFVASPSSIAQLPCRKGTYQSTYGGAECKPCDDGFICPRDQMTGTEAAPAGAFSTGTGNTFASKCAPGNYTALPGQPACLRCPAGFQCLQEGTSKPVACQAGFYRPLDDGTTNTISCLPCPEGTYSEVVGATDISSCIPCPAGVVCAITGTADMSRATKCADGYVCGTGTSGSSQFAEKCPAGFYCPAGTAPQTKYTYPCEEGYYCFEQSTPSTAKQLRCPSDRYCLRGTGAIQNGTNAATFFWALASAPVALLTTDSIQYLQDQIAASRARSGTTAAEATATIAATIQAALIRTGRRLLSAAAIFEELSGRSVPRDGPVLPPSLDGVPSSGPTVGNLSAVARIWSKAAPRRELLQSAVDSLSSLALSVPAGLKCPDGSKSIDECYSTGDLQRTIDPTGAALPDSLPAKLANYTNLILAPTGRSLTRSTDPSTGAGGMARKGNATFYAPDTRSGYSMIMILFNFPALIQNAKTAAPGAPVLNYTKQDFGIKFVSRVYDKNPPPSDGTPPPFNFDSSTSATNINSNRSLSEKLPFMLRRTDGNAVDPFSIVQVNLLPMSDMTPAFYVDLELFNPASLVGFDTMATQPIATVMYYAPSRATLGTNKAFVAIVSSKTQKNDFVSPTNLQSLTYKPNRNEPGTWFETFMYNQTDTSHPFLLTVASTDFGPIDPSSKDPSGSQKVSIPTDADGNYMTFVLPYLPYFSNCEGYGRYMPMFAIFEDSVGCNLTKQEETIPTLQYNPFGAPPKGDACNYELSCVYEEDLAGTEGQSATYWFEPTDGKTLFQIPWTPVLPAEVDNPEKFWNTLQNSGQFATADTKTDSDGTASLWSSSGSKLAAHSITLDLQYFQTSQTSKRVVQTFVTLGDFEPVTTHDGTYTLKIKMKPMTWFELLNAFALGLEVYAIIGALVTITCLAIVFAFFYFHRWYWSSFERMKSKRPPLRGWSYLRTTHPAVLMGTSVGAIPMLFALLFVLIFIKVLKPFEKQVGRWQDWGSDTALGADQVDTNQAARFGTALFACSLYFLWNAACVMQPDPDYERRNDPYHKKLSDRLGTHSLNRGMFMGFCFGLIGLLVCLMEWSYSNWFSQNIWVSVILLRIGAIVLEATLETSLRQSLLASPMLVAYDMVQFMCTIAAENFVAFLASFYFDLGLKIMDIVYLGSRSVWLMNNGPRIAREKVTRFFLHKTLVKSPLWRFTTWAKHIAIPEVEKGEKAKEDEDAKKMKEDEVDALEAVVDTAGNYSVDAASSVLSPFLLIIFYIFDNEFKFQDVYNFSKLAPLYYLVFVLVVMGAQPIVDVVLLQVVELHLKCKIYEYFKHQAKEFRRRRHWWKALDKEQEDETVPMTYRSIHMWAFSSQYYAVVSLAASALIGLVFSVECWLRQSFDPLEDPMLVLIIGGSLLGCKVIKIICEAAAYALNVWNCRKRFTLSRKQLERMRAQGKTDKRGRLSRMDSMTTGVTGVGSERGSGTKRASSVASFSMRTTGSGGGGSASTRNQAHRGSISSGSGVLRGNARFQRKKGSVAEAARDVAGFALQNASGKGAQWAALLRSRLAKPEPPPPAADPKHFRRRSAAEDADDYAAYQRWRESRQAQRLTDTARRQLQRHERLFNEPPVPGRRSRSAPRRRSRSDDERRRQQRKIRHSFSEGPVSSSPSVSDMDNSPLGSSEEEELELHSAASQHERDDAARSSSPSDRSASRSRSSSPGGSRGSTSGSASRDGRSVTTRTSRTSRTPETASRQPSTAATSEEEDDDDATTVTQESGPNWRAPVVHRRPMRDSSPEEAAGPRAPPAVSPPVMRSVDLERASSPESSGDDGADGGGDSMRVSAGSNDGSAYKI